MLSDRKYKNHASPSLFTSARVMFQVLITDVTSKFQARKSLVKQLRLRYITKKIVSRARCPVRKIMGCVILTLPQSMETVT